MIRYCAPEDPSHSGILGQSCGGGAIALLLAGLGVASADDRSKAAKVNIFVGLVCHGSCLLNHTHLLNVSVVRGTAM
jgi:hypothetical protein